MPEPPEENDPEKEPTTTASAKSETKVSAEDVAEGVEIGIRLIVAFLVGGILAGIGYGLGAVIWSGIGLLLAIILFFPGLLIGFFFMEIRMIIEMGFGLLKLAIRFLLP